MPRMGIPLLLAGAVILAVIGHNLLLSLILAVLLVVSYLVSLRLHPLGPRCRRCKGTGVQRGAVFRYSLRLCTRCGGLPVRGRYGVRTLSRNGQVWGEAKAAAARDRRSRRFGR
jgi:hypothetical protein